MTGGANNVGPRVISGANLTNTSEATPSPKTSTSSFEEVLGRTADPKFSFLGLGKVLQNTQLTTSERQVACQSVICEVLGPNNPYQPLAKNQSFMAAVSGLLAEDPRLGVMVERYSSRKV